MFPELALSLALCCAQEAPADATTLLRLKSGAIVFGEIVTHAPDGVRLKRLETGGEVGLTWDFLDPDEAAGLQRRFGYVEAEAEELLVDADRLQLADGNELVGRIVNRTEQHLWVKRAEGTVPILKSMVRGPVTSVRAPALDVYTREELYQQRAFELQGLLVQDGAVGARAHDELARYAERLLDFGHALEHYERARALDPQLDPARITTALERARGKAALQVQLDLLNEIDLQRMHRRYDKAIAALDSFRRLYPQSPLLDDLNKLQARVGKSQERDAREVVVTRWYYWSVRLAREAARKKTYEEVTAYLDEKMSEEIAQRVMEDLQEIVPGIDADRTRSLWAERKGGKYRYASYGYGTWLLGESARAEIDKKEGDAAAPEEGTQAAERKRIDERIKRYLENQKLTRSAAQSTDKDEDPQVFWEAWNWAGRAQWVLAYYAEKAGDMRDVAGRLSNCRECGGTGARDMLFSGSAITGDRAGEVLVPCPSCHTFGVVRRVRYR